jgi:hypothetical protein
LDYAAPLKKCRQLGGLSVLGGETKKRFCAKGECAQERLT